MLAFTVREWHVIAFDLRKAADGYLQDAIAAALDSDFDQYRVFIYQALDAQRMADRIERSIAG